MSCRDGSDVGANPAEWRFLEAAPAAIVITDAELDAPGPRIVFVNRAFEEMTGFTRDRVLGATPRILQGPETDASLFPDMRSHLGVGWQWRGETVNYRRDGTAFRVRWSLSPVRDERGHITHYMAVQEDVTEEHRRERERHRLDQLVTRFVDAAPDAAVIVDENLRVLRINAGAARTFGWTAEELEGAHVDTLIPPRYREAHRQHVETFAVEPGQGRWMSWRGEVAALHRDGFEFPAWASLVKLDERAAEGFAVFLRDLSAWKAQQRRLDIHERRLRQAQHIAHLGHWSWEAETGEVTWSEELFRLLGYAPEALRPGIKIVLNHVDPAERDRAREFFDAALRGEGPDPMDVTVVRRDGAWRTLHLQAEAEHDGDGTLVAVFGVVQDVTKQRATEQKLANANLELDAANSAKTRFLAMVGHELRTPLNAINGFAELLQQEVHGPLGASQYAEYTRHITESGEHLARLVDSLLDVTRVEAGDIALDEQHTSVGALLESVVERARAEAARRGVHVELAPGPDRCLRADISLLEDALLHLLRNAIQFSPDAGVVRVEAGETAEGAYRVRVTDEGPGIPRDAIGEVTRPFVQVDGSLARTQEGMGLGLYFTAAYLNLHGGSVELDSPASGGTVATAWLPRRRILGLPEYETGAA